MTDFNRPRVPDQVRTNAPVAAPAAAPSGASSDASGESSAPQGNHNPWWANAVVYQIYPRSFQDTNGDGCGDLPGITSRLDYLADLGVDVLWLSPVYKSPQDDNGYDISDYQDIDPMFGTLSDMDRLLAEAHKRGLKVVMDLVVNHTSDEHAWFQASRKADDPHADWYWWRPAKEGHEPGTPGAEPNSWGSYFGGSAWQYDPQRGEYYLHQFSRKQPDLNWENPRMRQAVYAMMNWWLDRGIDGFRMDVITLISKHVDADGELPGVGRSTMSAGPVGPEGYSNPGPLCQDGPRLDEFLQEMHHEVFDGRHGYMTVGEAPGISPARDEFITNPANRELDMLFLFEHTDIDHGPESKWDVVPWKLTDLKKALGRHQRAVARAGWASLFFDNHDQPRSVSRWGDTSTDRLRVLSAKALALLMHMHRGTPYIYQGEELGMTNAGFTRLDQYRDLESINLYHQRVDQAGIVSGERMLAGLAAMSRDNSRTPMQWDDGKYAGFMAEYAPCEPWIPVNPNKDRINAASQTRDPDSVFSFYRRLIELRHSDVLVSAGEWDLLDPEDEQVYAFTRSLPVEQAAGIKEAEGHKLLVVVNASSRSAKVPAQTRALLGGHAGADQILLSTYKEEETTASLLIGKLSPWEAFVYRL